MKIFYGGIIFLFLLISCNIENPSNGLSGNGTETLNNSQGRDWYPVLFLTTDGKRIYGAYLDPPYFNKVYTVPSGYVLDNISWNNWQLWVTGKITSNNYGFCGVVDYWNQTLTVKKTYYPYDSRQDVGVGGLLGPDNGTSVNFGRYHSSTKQYYRARQSNNYQWETIKTSLAKNAKRIDTRPEIGENTDVIFINPDNNYVYMYDSQDNENKLIASWVGIQAVDVTATIRYAYAIQLNSKTIRLYDFQTRSPGESYTIPASQNIMRIDYGGEMEPDYTTQVCLLQDGLKIVYRFKKSQSFVEYSLPEKMRDLTVDAWYNPLIP